MGDNITPIGSRVKLVDPNKFSQQSSSNIFGDTNYNMSVNLEDLSIMVEMTTETKRRTLLSTDKNTNFTVTNNGKKARISFIDGSGLMTDGTIVTVMYFR